MNRHRRSTFIAAWFGAGFLILFLAASAVESYGYLTTSNFEGLYDLPKSQQTLRGWLSLQSGFLAEYCLAGAVGGCVALASGLVAARMRKREA
jgi:hypothetical protein